MAKHGWSIVFWGLLICATGFGQSSFQELTPGTSTRGDVESVLGQPTRTLSATQFEYKPPAGIARVEVAYRAGSAVVERMEVYLVRPVSRTALLKKFNLPQSAEARRTNAEGRLVEYFGGSSLLVLVYATADPSSGINELGYCSREAFARADAKVSGARQNPAPPAGPTSRSNPDPAVTLTQAELPDSMHPPAGVRSATVDRTGRTPASGDSSCFAADVGAGNPTRSVHYNWAAQQNAARLDGNLRNKLGLLFHCPALSDDRLANAFANISVLVARYVPDANCFNGNRGVTGIDFAAHRDWARARSRQEVLVNLQWKVSAAMKCLERNRQLDFFADVSVVIANSGA